MKNRKKLIFLLMIIAALFLLSGCSIPTEELPDGTEVIKLITSETTFKSIMDTESWFDAFFVYPMAKAINIMTPKMGVAAAIAVVTIVVNVIVLLFTLKSSIANQRMQEMQPEMQKIQKKYEGKTDEASQMKQSQEMMALYKKYDVNPLGAILPTFLQMPILFAIYHSVQRAEVVKAGTFLGMSLNQTPWDGLKNGEFLYVALFVVMFIAQFASMKLPQFLAEHKAKKEAEAQHRKYVKPENSANNMMYSMMLVIMIMAVMWPAAMTLYWTISSLVNIAKTLLVQLLIKNKPVASKK